MSTVKEEKKVDKKETYWTPTEKESLKESYGTEILVDKYNISKEVVSLAYPQISWGGRS